jgi:hypothetical protein
VAVVDNFQEDAVPVVINCEVGSIVGNVVPS